MMPVFECNISEGQCCSADSDVCYAGSVGRYAVNATSAQDVKKAVAFAAQHNIALSVKTSGHDFQGRSSNKDTLNVWLHNLKNVTYIEDWMPSECETPEPPRKVMEVLGGNQWGEVYELMTEKEVNKI